MGAIKKAFYLSAIKEPTTAFGTFPWNPAGGSCRKNVLTYTGHGSAFGGMLWAGKWWKHHGSTHFVASHFWLVVQGFHLVPVQDDLGVGRVPHDVPGGLARCYTKNRTAPGYWGESIPSCIPPRAWGAPSSTAEPAQSPVPLQSCFTDPCPQGHGRCDRHGALHEKRIQSAAQHAWDQRKKALLNTEINI